MEILSRRRKGGLLTTLVKLSVLSLVVVLLLQLFLRDSENFQIRRILGSGVASIFSASGGPTSRLIDDIRKAVKIAAGGSDITFSAVDRQIWETLHPCKSRAQLEQFYRRRKGVDYIPVSQRWGKILDEYAVLHRVCMSRIGDVKEYFASKNDSTGCKFVVAEAHYGLGNKIYHISSLLVFAVLTQRVILIPRSTYVPDVVCQPLPGSSWSMSDDVHEYIKSNRYTDDQLFAGIDDSQSQQQPLKIYAAQGGGVWGPSQRFWCDKEQELFREITWLTYDGCLYHLPRLFSVPTFRPILEDIFPERVVFTHVLRTTMLPADDVWERILQVQKVHIGNASRQIGVQPRILNGGEKHYKKVKEVVNKNIWECLSQSEYLPERCPKNAVEAGAAALVGTRFENCSSPASIFPNSEPRVTKVFIASLFDGFRKNLEDKYRRRDTVTGESLEFVQLSNNKKQREGVEEDSQALVEIMTLSFSDVLLVTPFSTFGGLAQAYGTQLPVFIQFRHDETTSTGLDACQRGVSKEPCCLGADPVFHCRYDRTQSTEVRKSVPYLEHCMYIETGGSNYGMLLMNKER